MRPERRTGARRAGALIFLAPAACHIAPVPDPGPVPVPGHAGAVYSAPTRMEGTLVIGFEVFSFNDCWLDMSREASAQFRRLAPEASGRGPFYYRAVAVGRTAPPGSYGHLGAYRCQIQVGRFITLDQVRGPA